uniref:zinc finger protein 554-like isoform X1 n=2 Tax=Myxine glutinosa TaxID=7769 RepID=UPI00358FF6D4
MFENLIGDLFRLPRERNIIQDTDQLAGTSICRRTKGVENLEDAVDPQNIPPSSQRTLNQVKEMFEDASPTQSSNGVSTEPDVIVVVKEEPNVVDGLISQGEIYPVQVESLEGNNASSSTEALSCVSVTEDSYDLQKESSSDSCSAAERSTDRFCELKSRSPLTLKDGFLRKQTHPSDSSRNIKSGSCDGHRKLDREYSKHKKIHFGGMQYKCLVCSKSFSNLRNMENHMKTQNGKCPLKCSICDKAVTKLSDLKKHMRIHNGERPYNCSICGKSFTQIGNMNRHMMIHTGERPHNCPVCGRGFAESAKLNAHMRTHTGVHYGLPYSIS